MADLSEQAFGELYEAASRPLWVYVYRTTSHAADADDIVQEAFCRILKADVGELSAEDLRRYLFRTASNLVADRWRRAERDRASVPQMPRETFVKPVAAPDVEVTRTFAQLKPRDRALLWLAYVEEQDHRQVAATLGVRPSSVKVLLSRARSRLRQLLQAARGVGV